MRRRGASTGLGAVVAVSSACLAIGCGGGSSNAGGDGGSGTGSNSDKARAVAALVGIGDALARTDPNGACALLSKKARSDAAKTVPGATSCESAMTTILSVSKRADRQRFARVLRDAEKRVVISGDDATISYPANPGSKPMAMRREGGSWKIAKNPLYYNPK